MLLNLFLDACKKTSQVKVYFSSPYRTTLADLSAVQGYRKYTLDKSVTKSTTNIHKMIQKDQSKQDCICREKPGVKTSKDKQFFLTVF